MLGAIHAPPQIVSFFVYIKKGVFMHIFDSYNKNCTAFLKGVAIILMVAHHMWAFKSPADFMGMDPHLASLFIGLGKAGKICVAMFVFISGYGLFLKRNDGILQNIKRVYMTAIHFWVTVLPILLAFFLAGFYKFDIIEFLKNMLFLVNSYNGHWWFMQTYLLFLIFFPLLVLLFKFKLTEIMSLLFSFTLFRFLAYEMQDYPPVHHFLYYIPFLFLGATFAKHNLFQKITDCKKKKTLLVCCLSLSIALLGLRMYTGFSEMLFALIPVFFSCFLIYPMPSNLFSRGLVSLGKISMGIWLVHFFFIKLIPIDESAAIFCIIRFAIIMSLSTVYTILTDYLLHKVLRKK